MPPSFTPNIQWTLLRNTPAGPGTASLRGFNPLRPGHSSPSSTQPHLEPLSRGSATPHLHHVTMMDSVCPPPLSFAITHGIAYCFLFLRLLRCFSSAGSPSPEKGSDQPPHRVQGRPGSPIRQSQDPRMHAPPLGLSQLATAFISDSSQAIPQTA